MRRFEFSDGVSNKFWEVEQAGCELNICFGKIGTAGQRQSKSHADEAKATAAMDKVIREKTAKGYVETTAGASAPVPAPVAPATPKPLKSAAAKPKASAPAVAAPPPVPAAPPTPIAPPVTGDIAPWLACGALLDIPPKMAALALPSRRFPGKPPRANADQCWKLFLGYAQTVGTLSVKESDPVFQDAVSEAAQRIEQGARSGSPQSDAVLLAFATTFDTKLKAADGSPFVDFLVAEKGLPYALDTLLAALEQMSIWRLTYGSLTVWRVGSEPTMNLSRCLHTFSPTELALRAHLANAPQAVWEQCVETIRGALARVPLGRQALLGVLLPDVPDLSNAMAIAHGDQMNNGDLWLRLSVTAPESLAAQPWVHFYAESFAYYNVPAAVAAILLERGTGALPLLEPGAAIDAAGDALTAIGMPGAVTALARAFIKTSSGNSLARVKAAALRWPYAAMAGLCELLAVQIVGIPSSLRAILTTLVYDHADAVPAFRPWISPEAVAVLDGLAASVTVAVDVADEAELPSVLVNPPWLLPPKKPIAPIALAPLPLAPSEHWSEEERQDMLQDERHNAYPWSDEQLPAPKQAAAAIAAGDVTALLAAWNASLNDGYYIGGCVHAIVDLPEPYNIAVWNAMAQYPINSPGYAIATLGLRGLAGVVTMCERRPSEELTYARYFAAVELAAPVARAYAGLKAKEVRATARSWLLAYPEHAACGLIAPALGKASAARDCAADTLRMLAAAGHDALLMEVASRYQQPAVSAALRALLDQNPLDLYPAKIGEAPAFWMPRNWTRPRLASNGKVLPIAALDHLGAMLRFPQGERIYPGITQVLQACTPASLGEFAWELFLAWQSAGMDSKENWAYAALRLLGNDDVARKLTPIIRDWPGEGQHARAVAGLDVLVAIGTDTAMLLLNGIAQKVRSKGLQDSAREKIGEIAEARNMTTAELEDRLAPDLGLDEHGTLLLDFGPRQFRVGFDETLKPYVRDAEGARLADLPKPRQSDDAALSGAAVERYKLLKKDARTIASQQVQRLEVAMCAQRRWEPQVFATFLAGHPLLRHLVQRLVWGAWRGEHLVGCFRVGADAQFTDAEDDAFALPQGDDIRIGLPHALDMPASDSAAFGQLFADYELMQPFTQLGRDTYALGADELAADKLIRWDGVVVPTGQVLGLVNRGWQRGPSQDRGYIREFTKALAGGRLAELHIEPGIMAGVVDEHPEQTLRQVIIATAKRGRTGKPVMLSALDPVAASELIRDMEKLRA